MHANYVAYYQWQLGLLPWARDRAIEKERDSEGEERERVRTNIATDR